MHVGVFGNVDDFVWSSGFISGHSSNTRDIREVALQNLDLRLCRNILDIGCAFGFCIPNLRGRVHPDAHVTGIELHHGYEPLFLEAVRGADCTGEFLSADVSDLEHLDGRGFDLIISSYSLYFFPWAIPAIAGLLKSGGHFIALTHAEGHLRELTGLVEDCLRSQGVCAGCPPFLERLIQAFSDQNGGRLLSPWFQEVRRVHFRNSLVIRPDDLSGLIRYIRFKYSFLVPETSLPREKVLHLVEERLDRRFRQEGKLLITKDDVVFMCSGPQNGTLSQGL